MAYVRNNWNCGDVISAQKLNNIEDGIEEALECCSGGGSAGYNCTEIWTTLTEETVTTSAHGSFIIADLSYSQPIDAETIQVTFNGTEYECQRMTTWRGYEYGAPLDSATNQFDWSEYPFHIARGGVTNGLLTETAGTYDVKIEAVDYSVMTTPCFQKAVESVQGGGCEETVSIDVPVNAVTLGATPLEVSNTTALTINANSTASFVGDANVLGPSPIVGFDTGDDALVIISAIWATAGMVGGRYTIKVKNTSDSAVNLAQNACKILISKVSFANTAVYTLCGHTGGDDDPII